MTTMKEISEIAGVSVSTVSLVLNNRDSGRVKADIAEKIRKVARDLGYAPNQVARSLRTSRTHILGFLSNEVATTPYAGAMIQGAQDAASAYGYVIITVTTDHSNNADAEIRTLERYGVDGFFVAAMSNRHMDVSPLLKQYPTVLVNATEKVNSALGPSDITRHTSIAPDEYSIGYDATRRLLDAGCTRIAYVGCSEPMLAEGLRYEGYVSALREAGITLDPQLCVRVGNNDPALRSAYDMMSFQKPDGVFCFNDARAWYVYESAARLGLRIGKDISVIGVDNHRVFAETLDPQLTTIELPHYEMGYWAACKLIAQLEGKTEEDFALPQTTAALPSVSLNDDVFITCTLIEKESIVQS